MFESTQIIGEKQYEHAMKLFEDAATPLKGEVSFCHSFVDMANLKVTLQNGTVVNTCPAALGYSFAAGTTDGPGQFDFTQHTNTVSHHHLLFMLGPITVALLSYSLFSIPFFVE